MLVLIPLMLGMKSINEEYYSTLKSLLSFSSTVGIMGGKPKSALYLVGFQGNKFILLDPHKVQETSDDPRSYHASSAKVINIKKLDSSMAAGFYFQNE